MTTPRTSTSSRATSLHRISGYTMHSAWSQLLQHYEPYMGSDDVDEDLWDNNASTSFRVDGVSPKTPSVAKFHPQQAPSIGPSGASSSGSSLRSSSESDAGTEITFPSNRGSTHQEKMPTWTAVDAVPAAQGREASASFESDRSFELPSFLTQVKAATASQEENRRPSAASTSSVYSNESFEVPSRLISAVAPLRPARAPARPTREILAEVHRVLDVETPVALDVEESEARRQEELMFSLLVEAETATPKASTATSHAMSKSQSKNSDGSSSSSKSAHLGRLVGVLGRKKSLKREKLLPRRPASKSKLASSQDAENDLSSMPSFVACSLSRDVKRRGWEQAEQEEIAQEDEQILVDDEEEEEAEPFPESPATSPRPPMHRSSSLRELRASKSFYPSPPQLLRGQTYDASWL